MDSSGRTSNDESSRTLKKSIKKNAKKCCSKNSPGPKIKTPADAESSYSDSDNEFKNIDYDESMNLIAQRLK